MLWMMAIAALVGLASPIRSAMGSRQTSFVHEEGGNLPEGLVAVEYLESTGNEYIDTGFYSTVDTEIDCIICEGSLDDFPHSSYAFTGNTINGYGHGWTYVSYDWRTDGFWHWMTPYNIVCDEEFKICTMDSNRNIYINGSFVRTSCIDTYESVETRFTRMYLFASLIGDKKRCGRFKVKHVCIRRSGEILLDLIPCRTDDENDSVGYFYDMVSGGLFGNAGTGMFLIGPDL